MGWTTIVRVTSMMPLKELEHSGIWMAMAMVLGITYRRFEVAILLQAMWKMILIAMIQTHSSIFTLKVWKVGLSYDDEMKDENCNGIVNEDSAFGAPIWYQDADADGYGSNVVLRPS